MFNYLASAPDSLDLVNRITNSRAQQLQNAIYAAQAPQIQAQTAYTQENTRLLPQQRDAALLAAAARSMTAPSQIYKNTLSVVPEAMRAKSMADNSGQVQGINNAAFNMLSGGVNPMVNQILQKYGMGVSPQQGNVSQQGAQSPMATSQMAQAPMQGSPQGQVSPQPQNYPQQSQQAPSNGTPSFADIGNSMAAQKSMTKSQQDKLPFSLNLSTTLDALKSQVDNATAFAGDPIALAKQDGAAKYNATLGKVLGQIPLDPNYIKRQTYMDSINSFVQQARQTYGASIQPGSLEHFEEMVTPKWDDTPATFKQRFNVAVNNFENEVKTFKTPVNKLVSPEYQQQQGRNVVSGANQAQQEALQTNAQVGNQSAMAGNNLVPIMGPNGKKGKVPASRYQEFLNKPGFKAV